MAGPWEKYAAPADGPWSKYGGGDKGSPPPEPTPALTVGAGEDVARSAGAGLREGIESAIGGFGDVGKYQKGIAEWAAGKLGLSPETGEKIGNVAQYLTPFPAAPTTDQIQGATNDVAGPAYKPQTTTGEYAKTTASFAPALIGGEGSAAQRLITRVLLPGVASETAGQVTKGTAAEPYARIAGALAGGVVPAAAGRTVSPFQNLPERERLAQTLANEGVDLTAGQRTGSNMLRYAESELGGMAGQRFNEQQGKQFTRAALQRIGENADRATPEVMDRAYQRIGQQFDDLAARNTVLPDQQMLTDLRSTINEYGSLVPESSRAPIIENVTNDIVDAFRRNGQLSGEAYQSLTSRLARAARGTKDPELSQALRGIREDLDDAMERSIAANNPADIGAWRETRNQYRNFITLEQAATGAGENAAAGIISPSALRNATLAKQGRRNYARGQGDFADLARAGEGVMKPLPQSGTAPRAAVRGAFSTMGGIAGAAGGGGVPGGALGALAGAAIPPLVGRAILSPIGRALLGNQVGRNLPSIDPRMAAVIAALAAGNQRALPSP